MTGDDRFAQALADFNWSQAQLRAAIQEAQATLRTTPVWFRPLTRIRLRLAIHRFERELREL